MRRRLAVPSLMVVLGGLGLSVRADDPAVDYARDIKPLLARQCVSCHGAEKPRAGLRLDTAAGALKGGQAGPSVVPGKPDESELFLAVIGEGIGERMPLKRPPLAEAEITLLRRWIETGAHFPEGETPSEGAPTHWAFIPPRRTEPPAVARADWARNPIDRFVLAPLERDGIAPSAEAGKATLIRRVSLDIIGLPPTPDEIDAFVSDTRPDAYERLVDRLLASPHFGERWGRLWLDAARYADSNGYSIDAPRQIWKYRDWVIDALNRDQPFDEFTIDQLAGDLRPNATLEQRIATGFHRNTPINQEGGIDLEQFRIESVMDRVSTTGTVWLGLTIGCCQCHDHKYDPITQKEYYQFFAFFNNVDEPNLPVATPEDIARQEQVAADVEAYVRGIERDEALLKLQKPWETGLDTEGRQKQSQEVREAFNVVFDERTADQNRPVFIAFLEQAKDKLVEKHRKAIGAIKKRAPKVVTTMVVRERKKSPRETHLLMGGDFTRPGGLVGPGVPSVLNPLPRGAKESPTRLELARWLMDRENPLTARVTVNRLWQTYFGRGLVETDGDFGTQGAPPSHPELLDWLATELVRRDWSLKAVHRLIVTSATYRQSSTLRADLARVDPENRRLARQARLRLDAELVRDAALVASGLLTTTIGGPSVFPPQPEGVLALGQVRREWNADEGPNRYRRGLYTYFWRATPHPLFTVFDAADGVKTCTRRVRSNTPLQALTLLNDEGFVEFAQALADRVLRDGPETTPERIRRAFRLVLGRAATAAEVDRLSSLLARQRGLFATNAEAAAQLAPSATEPSEAAAWTTLARVLFNLDEFITRE